MIGDTLKGVIFSPSDKLNDMKLLAEQRGGDQSLPAESALTYPLKWAYEFDHKAEYIE